MKIEFKEIKKDLRTPNTFISIWNNEKGYIGYLWYCLGEYRLTSNYGVEYKIKMKDIAELLQDVKRIEIKRQYEVIKVIAE